MRKLMILAFSAIALSFALPCAAAGNAGKASAAVSPRRSDAEIEQAIRAKLAKSKIGKDGFTVTVKGGVATWEGTTNVMQHKGAATRMAKSAGAIRVVNHIKVSAAALERARGNLDAGLRRVQVKTE